MRQELKRGNISAVIPNACRRRQEVKNPALLITGFFRRLRLRRMTLLLATFLILHFTFYIMLALPALAESGTTVSLDNPLGETNFRVIVGNIIKALTGGAGMIALLMFIYGGFTWLTSGGNPEKIKKGRDILVWSTAGMVVMFSSYFVVRFIILAITRGTVAP